MAVDLQVNVYFEVLPGTPWCAYKYTLIQRKTIHTGDTDNDLGRHTLPVFIPYTCLARLAHLALLYVGEELFAYMHGTTATTTTAMGVSYHFQHDN